MTSSPFFLTSTRSNLLVIPDLVAHWNFNEGTGTSVTDVTGNGRTGTATGSPAWETGRFGQCMVFDGTDDYVSVVDHASLNFGASQDFTVSFWVKTTTAAATDTWPFMINKSDTSTSPVDDWSFFQSSIADPEGDVWFFRTRIAGSNYFIYSSSSFSLRDGSWHHLIGQREGTTIRIFQDSVSRGTLTNAGISGSLTNADNLFFGKLDVTGFEYRYTGSIDDARIYSRALTTTEITALYNGNVA